ncbi:unnamed protein product, partial [Ilex paraguariensis]
ESGGLGWPMLSKVVVVKLMMQDIPYRLRYNHMYFEEPSHNNGGLLPLFCSGECNKVCELLGLTCQSEIELFSFSLSICGFLFLHSGLTCSDPSLCSPMETVCGTVSTDNGQFGK